MDTEEKYMDSQEETRTKPEGGYKPAGEIDTNKGEPKDNNQLGWEMGFIARVDVLLAKMNKTKKKGTQRAKKAEAQVKETKEKGNRGPWRTT